MELAAHAATAGATMARMCMAAVVTVRAVATTAGKITRTCLAAVATVRAVTAMADAVK